MGDERTAYGLSRDVAACLTVRSLRDEILKLPGPVPQIARSSWPVVWSTERLTEDQSSGSRRQGSDPMSEANAVLPTVGMIVQDALQPVQAPLIRVPAER